MAKDCCTNSIETDPSCTLPKAGEEKGCHSVPTQPTDKITSSWFKIRSGVMFGIGCVTSPCCTPLLVPLALMVLAGTPVAVWLSASLSWVYGGLTLVSIISFVVGLRWLRPKTASKHRVAPSAHTILEMKNLGEVG